MPGHSNHTFSIIIPIYRNAENIASLRRELDFLAGKFSPNLELIFVNDGTPDSSVQLIRTLFSDFSGRVRLIHHSRNFGAFNAIRTGLASSSGKYIAVLAADLQEPITLIEDFFLALSKKNVDIVVGTRQSRGDSPLTKFLSGMYWSIYRKLVNKEIPKGGVDVFAITHRFRDQLLLLGESRSSLIAQLFWLGFRRIEIPYERKKRESGTSSWTVAKKIDYMLDSIFAFTDLPIRIILLSGVLGIGLSFVLGTLVLYGRVSGTIESPGFATTLITILFFGSLNLLGLGLVGNYAWRSFENSKVRPHSLTMFEEEITHDNK